MRKNSACRWCSSHDLRVHGLKRAQPDVQGDVRRLGARRAACVEGFRREVQARRRRGDRPGLARENRLIAHRGRRLRPAGGYTEAAGRGPCRPGARRCRRRNRIAACVRRTAPRARISASSSSAKRTRSPMRILRPGRTSASQVMRSPETGRIRNTSTCPLRYSRRLGLFLPTGSEPTPARWPYRRDGNTFESFSTRQSPGPEEIRQVAEMAVFPTPLPLRWSTSMRDAARSSSGRWAMRSSGR